MKKFLNNKIPPALVGFYQAIGVLVYTSIVALFIFSFSQTKTRPGLAGLILMLTLLVFSASITGSLVFGLPVYLALKNNINRALSILFYTLLFLFAALVVVSLTILFVR